jgi:hypothetical protein
MGADLLVETLEGLLADRIVQKNRMTRSPLWRPC